MVRFCRVLSDLKRIVRRVEKLCDANRGTADYECLQEFTKAVCQYRDFLKSKLQAAVISDRSNIASDDYDVETTTSHAQTHSSFDTFRLERWLDYKCNEWDMMNWMAIGAGKGIVFLADRRQLEQQLASNKTFALVLYVPPLDELTSSALAAMKTSVNTLEEYFSRHVDNSGKRCKDPWHMVLSKRKFVLDVIGELASHFEKNREISGQVQFIVTFGEIKQTFGCSYSVYEGKKLLKSNLRQLPSPPTGLRVHLPNEAKPRQRRVKRTPSPTQIEWNYEDIGIPAQFVIEYRRKESADSWIQQRTTETGQTRLAVTLPTGVSMEFRIAVESCIGLSEFSDVVYAEVASDEKAFANCPKVDKTFCLQPPSGLKVTSFHYDTAQLEWTPPPGDLCCLDYRLKYWKKGEDCSSAKQEETFGNRLKTSIWLNENLQPETTYLFNVVSIVSGSESKPSETVEFTFPKEVRFGKNFVSKCQKIRNQHGLDIYAVPLTKMDGQPATVERFIFDAKDNRDFIGWPRTIMLVGSSASAKMSLINSLINYVFYVNLEDPFRFQLIDPSRDASEKVAVYDIHNHEEFGTFESLKIIDTPSYVEGDSGQNRRITELIRKYFEEKKDIMDKVDMIGFVLDSSIQKLTPVQFFIYCSLIIIFGDGVKKNIKFLLTSGDNTPALLASIEKAGLMPDPQKDHFELDSSLYFGTNKNVAGVDSEISLRPLQNLYNALSWSKTNSISLKKQAKDKRKRLLATVSGLCSRMYVDVEKSEQLRNLKKRLNSHRIDGESKLKWNTVVSKVPLPFGKCVTNCNECQITCHAVCGAKNRKSLCDVMDHSSPEHLRRCLVCPGKCLGSKHSSDPFKWSGESEMKKTLDEIKKEYEIKLKKKLTQQEFKGAVRADVDAKQKGVTVLVEMILGSIQQLDSVANYLQLRKSAQYGDISDVIDSITQFIKTTISCEKKEKSLGFEGRVRKLENLRQVAFDVGRYSSLYDGMSSDSEEESDVDVSSESSEASP